MDFPTLCPECAQENRVDFADSSVHDVTCGRCGSRYCVFLRKQKFEVLFDLGTRALMDGYAREAVASFSASLERFMEFYVRAYALERAAGTETDLAAAVAALDGTWRDLCSDVPTCRRRALRSARRVGGRNRPPPPFVRTRQPTRGNFAARSSAVQ